MNQTFMVGVSPVCQALALTGEHGLWEGEDTQVRRAEGAAGEEGGATLSRWEGPGKKKHLWEGPEVPSLSFLQPV